LAFFSICFLFLVFGSYNISEWLSFPLLVAAVLITPQGAESPGSGRIGVTSALVFFPPEAVGARGGGGL